MPADFDIAIIGSGFGGSLLAMIARRLGRSVVLMDRARHPRFVIGESSTPLANLLLEQLAHRYDLPRVAPLSKWGTWQKAHPEIGCGLKRGFTFYHHAFGEPWRETPKRQNELLVAASPRDEIADTHWYRSDFDHFLVREAQAAGVEFIDDLNLQRAEPNAAEVRLCGQRRGKVVRLSAKFLVDGSGPRGCLHKLLGLKERPFDDFPATSGLYTHFRGVQRLDRFRTSTEGAPYPLDDAAVHHLFPGGWIWVLRFNNGITSAGVAAAHRDGSPYLAEGEEGWNRLLDRLLTVKAQFESAKPILPFVYTPQLSFQAETISGPRWVMLPSAAGFIDPLLSTGFPLNLLGITRLACLIESGWKELDLEAYAQQTRRELRVAERLVAALYRNMHDFELFSRISLLYFAAASFTETALRLGKPEIAGDAFLLDDHPQFGPAARDCLTRALSASGDRAKLISDIGRAIESVDIAGLSDFSRRNWYDVRADDLLAARGRLHSSSDEIVAMLARTGFHEMPCGKVND
jgi:FADH2 O2-dependent halogenase